jgi:hypothetical protein
MRIGCVIEPDSFRVDDRKKRQPNATRATSAAIAPPSSPANTKSIVERSFGSPWEDWRSVLRCDASRSISGDRVNNDIGFMERVLLVAARSQDGEPESAIFGPLDSAGYAGNYQAIYARREGFDELPRFLVSLT